ncbi:MAG: permease [Rhodopirellula sp.]|nr:permease [Rhodopirellula sp.]
MNEILIKAGFGGVIRMGEALMAATPTLLVGLLVAAILRFYFDKAGVRRVFGGSSLRSLPQSWAIGMLLPVCSIGVLPILLEMRRAKVKPGAMSAFALSAPLFNPLSLLYGVTLSRPYVILMFAAASLFLVTVVGWVWDRFGTADQSPQAPQGMKDTLEPTKNAAIAQTRSEPIAIIGVRRLFAMFVYASRQLVGPAGAWSLLGISGVGLLAALLPYGSLGEAMGRDDWWAPTRMVFVSVPVYATPMLAMSQLGMMFQHANSPGAAFILLVLGAGINLGTIGWMSRQFGYRSVMIWVTCLLVIVTSIAYGVNRPLVPPGVTPSSHTHAFDIYTNPIHQWDSTSTNFALSKLSEKFGLVEQIALSILAFLALAGICLRLAGVDEEKLASKTQPTRSSSSTPSETVSLGLDRIVGPNIVGLTLIIGLVAISIVMCYAFYPSRDECFEEIRFIRADALSGANSGDYEHAKFWIPRWDEWSRRMEVGVYLRSGRITPYQRMQGFLLRQKLDLLEHEVEHDSPDKHAISSLVAELMATNARWTNAYRKPYRPVR